MAPKKKKRASGKSKTKTSSTASKRRTSKKSGKRSGKRKKSKKAPNNAAEGGRAKSSYMIFCTLQRDEIVKKEGLSGVMNEFGETARALSQAWKDISATERQRYDAVADVEKSRVALLGMVAIAKLESDASKLIVTVKDTLTALTKAGVLLRQLPVGDQAVSALEALERKMSPPVRREVGQGMAKIASSSAAAAAIRQVLGPALSDRVVAMLRRCRDGISMSSPSSRTSANVAREQALPKPPAPIDDETRSRVVGLLLKTFARKLGRAEVMRCKTIENAVFAACAGDSRQYKGRARSLVFNLGADATDGSLLRRFMDGEVSAEELAKLGHEDLASNDLKRERQEMREKIMKEEVHLTGALRKRQRGLEVDRSRAAEKFAAPEEPSDDEPVQSSKATPAGSMASDGQLAGADELNIELPLDDGLGSTSSSSSSSSSSGSGSDSEESSESESSSD